MRYAPIPRPASTLSGRGVACLRATSRLTRRALATRCTGTPASYSREARAGRKGPISSPELPPAFMGSLGLADGRWWISRSGQFDRHDAPPVMVGLPQIAEGVGRAKQSGSFTPSYRDS